jgi:hypothetical protein
MPRAIQLPGKWKTTTQVLKQTLCPESGHVLA